MRAVAFMVPALLAVSAVAAPTVGAQSLLERTPNLSAGWVARGPQLHFHFVHRFSHSGEPERQVQNRPTFLLAAPVTPGITAGARYATRSDLSAGVPNEWELFVRTQPLTQARGAVVDLGFQAGHNFAAVSWDAELTAARTAGPLRGIVALRVLSSDVTTDEAALAVFAGALARVHRHVALAADVGRRTSGGDAVWAAGIHAQLPATPHTLSLHVSNASATTLHSASRAADRARWGFEFTVPITLRRYARSATASADARLSHADSVVRVDIRNLRYEPHTIRIPPGTTVEWVNGDPLEHTATAVDGSWDSGPIAPGASWRRRFDRAGRHEVTCTPHPFMRAEVVVE